MLCSTKTLYIGKGQNRTSGLYSVIFPAGIIRVPFNVSITNDNILEVNAKFDLTINQSSLPINVSTGSVYQATVTISDDDGK